VDLKRYFDLYEILESDNSTQEERRDFGLKHTHLKAQPLAQLNAWIEAHKQRLTSFSLGQKWYGYMYGVSSVLLLLALVLGFATGMGLLQYNGDAPVNLIYFLFVALVLPLFTMFLTLIAMWRASYRENILVHISPSFWLEKIVRWLRKYEDSPLATTPLTPHLLNWIVILRSQWLALTFSVGILLALLVSVATQDIAFSWSTTLQLDAVTFEKILHILAMPWHFFLEGATPSLFLIEQSHYFRLGGEVSQKMLSHREMLGEWWKFLAMVTLCYAIGLRVILLFLAKWGVARAVAQETMQLDGVERLLEEMNTPLVTTIAPKQERDFTPKVKEEHPQEMSALLPHYHSVQGWGFSLSQLRVMCDALGIEHPSLFVVGGSNTLEEDSAIVTQSQKRVLLFVKAWEPPTMDCMDFLESLHSNEAVEEIVLSPMGMAEEGYKATQEHLDIWERKVALFTLPKLLFSPLSLTLHPKEA